MKKRLFSLMLVFALALTMSCSAFADEYTDAAEDSETEVSAETAEQETAQDDYWKIWSQKNERWGSMSISSSGDSRYNMSDEGCLITAIAKLFIFAGQQDPETFTPADCLDGMLKYGLLSCSGALTSGFRMNTNGFLATYAPDLYYVPDYVHNAWSQSKAYSEISRMIEEGYYVIIRAYNYNTGNSHYMSVERLEDGAVYVMDNKSVIDLYNSENYGGVTQTLCFKYSGEYTYPARESILAERAAKAEAERLEQEKLEAAKEELVLLDNFLHIYDYFDGMFKDVTADKWYSTGIEAAYELGLVKGTADDEFGIGSDFSVAAAITVAARIHATYHSTGAEFVQGDIWYQTYVDYAVANGIIVEDRFADFDRSATRAETVEILAAALPADALGVVNEISFDYIPDVAEDAPYAEAVCNFYRAGVLTGDNDNAFSPENFIKREEAATIVARMIVTSMRRTFAAN